MNLHLPTSEQNQSDTPFSTTFTFYWASPPLHSNQRLHWAAKAKLTQMVRSAMHAHARHIPDLGKCEVELVWFVSDKRRRDADNVVPTLKALCDGLVDAEVVPDDTEAEMRKLMPRVVYEKGCTPHFEFTVRAVA